MSDVLNSPANLPIAALTNELAIDRTVLANERTLLAYLRTALALIALGVTSLEFLTQPLLHLTAYVVIGLGVAMLGIGTWRFVRMRRGLVVMRGRLHAAGAVESPRPTSR